MSTTGDTLNQSSDALPDTATNVSTSPSRKKVCTSKENAFQSDVWDHFTKFEEEGKPEGAKCNYCNAIYARESINETNMLKKHVTRCPKYPYHLDKKQKLQSFQMVGEEESSNSNHLCKFDQELCRYALAKMIIIDKLPFKFLEHEGFRNFCSVLQPEFKLVSRTTLARDCLAMYFREKNKLRNILKETSQRISLTVDCWTSLQDLSYMCLTSHFIDNDWKLHKRILNFCVISSDKGEAIGQAVEACLIEWGLDKLCTLTVDNASSNDDAIAYLKRKFCEKNCTLVLGGESFHMRCSSHILNLIVNDELNDSKDSITRIREAVRYIKSSPQREQHFKACIEKERIASKSVLCLDVQTRWSSTFLMLEAALKVQKAFERLEEEDPHYKLELSNEPPSKSDWDDARLLAKFLQKIYDTALRLSGCLYVTSNSYFQEVIGIESLLSEWAKSSDTCLSSMAFRMKSKFDMYCWSIETMDIMLLVALVLDPRFKMKYVKFCSAKLYPPHKVDELTHRVKEAMSRVFAEYQLYDSLNSSLASLTQKSNGMAVDQPLGEAREQEHFLDPMFEKYLEEENDMDCKSEVDRYLEESCEKCVPSFEILSWWKLNCSRYRVLAQVAKDFLAIPVSTVSSESAFSTRGRVLGQFSSSLTPKLVESLICAQDWLRASPLPIEVEETIQEIEEYESVINEA